MNLGPVFRSLCRAGNKRASTAVPKTHRGGIRNYRRDRTNELHPHRKANTAPRVASLVKLIHIDPQEMLMVFSRVEGGSVPK